MPQMTKQYLIFAADACVHMHSVARSAVAVLLVSARLTFIVSMQVTARSWSASGLLQQRCCRGVKVLDLTSKGLSRAAAVHELQHQLRLWSLRLESTKTPALGHLALDSSCLPAIPRTTLAHAWHLPLAPLLGLIKGHTMLLAWVLDVLASVCSQASVLFNLSGHLHRSPIVSMRLPSSTTSQVSLQAMLLH